MRLPLARMAVQMRAPIALSKMLQSTKARRELWARKSIVLIGSGQAIAITCKKDANISTRSLPMTRPVWQLGFVLIQHGLERILCAIQDHLQSKHHPYRSQHCNRAGGVLQQFQPKVNPMGLRRLHSVRSRENRLIPVLVPLFMDLRIQNPVQYHRSRLLISVNPPRSTLVQHRSLLQRMQLSISHPMLRPVHRSSCTEMAVSRPQLLRQLIPQTVVQPTPNSCCGIPCQPSQLPAAKIIRHSL